MVMMMTMIVINIHEAKAKLSEYLEATARGERVLICKRNRPVAELRPVSSARVAARPVGGAKGRFTVPASFFEPLPDDIVDTFFAEGTAAPRGALAERPGRLSSAHRRTRAKGRR
jgi:prevent-host-death family protein